MAKVTRLLIAVLGVLSMLATPPVSAAGATHAASFVPVYTPAAPHFAPPVRSPVRGPARTVAAPGAPATGSASKFFLNDPLAGLPDASRFCDINAINARIAEATERIRDLKDKNQDLFEKASKIGVVRTSSEQAIQTTAGEVRLAISMLDDEITSLLARKRRCVNAVTGFNQAAPVFTALPPLGEPGIPTLTNEGIRLGIIGTPLGGGVEVFL